MWGWRRVWLKQKCWEVGWWQDHWSTSFQKTRDWYCFCLFSPHPSSPPRLPAFSLPQIDFKDPKISNVGNNYLKSINGTEFWIPQTGEAKMRNAFASHKYAFKSALRYKIGRKYSRLGPGVDPGSLPSWKFLQHCYFQQGPQSLPWAWWVSRGW
jgi:hypothetical protein